MLEEIDDNSNFLAHRKGYRRIAKDRKIGNDEKRMTNEED